MSWEGEGEEDEALSNRQPTAETTSRIIYIDFCSFGRRIGRGGYLFRVISSFRMFIQLGNLYIACL